MPADPKPERRIRNPGVVHRALLAHPICMACGTGWPLTAHHLLPRGEGGDDVPGNVGGLCGHGTALCHGAFHGNPYTVPWSAGSEGKLGCYQRRDAEWVRRRVGEHLVSERPDVIEYVTTKLGQVAGLDYLARVYFIDEVYYEGSNDD